MQEQTVVSHLPCPHCQRRLSRFDVRFRRPAMTWLSVPLGESVAMHLRGAIWLGMRGVATTTYWAVVVLVVESIVSDFYSSPDHMPLLAFSFVFSLLGVLVGLGLYAGLEHQAGGASVLLTVAACAVAAGVILLGWFAVSSIFLPEYLTLWATLPGGGTAAVVVLLLAGVRPDGWLSWWW